MAQMQSKQTTAVPGKPAEQPSTPSADALDGFDEQYRELAKQRRFIREHIVTDPWGQASVSAAAPETPVSAAPSATARTILTREERAVISEMAKLAEQLVAARSTVAALTVRVERAEADLSGMHQRLMAARALVQDAQRATRASADRCAYLEGRCETLQEALELAVNASVLTRWRWRRQQRRARSFLPG